MTNLKRYENNQEKKLESLEMIPSGVACTEPKCKGEMMIVQPEINHPELSLKRAVCGKCGWKGWV